MVIHSGKKNLTSQILTWLLEWQHKWTHHCTQNVKSCVIFCLHKDQNKLQLPRMYCLNLLDVSCGRLKGRWGYPQYQPNQCHYGLIVHQISHHLDATVSVLWLLNPFYLYNVCNYSLLAKQYHGSFLADAFRCWNKHQHQNGCNGIGMVL